VICLAEDNPAAVLAAVADVLDGTAPVQGYVTVMEAHLLAGLAQGQLGDQRAAGQAAERALALAEACWPRSRRSAWTCSRSESSPRTAHHQHQVSTAHPDGHYRVDRRRIAAHHVGQRQSAGPARFGRGARDSCHRGQKIVRDVATSSASNRVITADRVTVIIVNERLGF
jgi:hypothetical protein